MSAERAVETRRGIPDEMTIVTAPHPGGPEVLTLERRRVPRQGHGEVLIKVAAAGLNGADLLQRRGAYALPPGANDVLGLEASGEIVAVGEGVATWRPGEQVCALLVDGGYAEYCVAPAVQCLPVPKGLGTIEAAALPEAVMTVWSNVFEIGGLRPKDTLLVHGGASGIGTMAIQLARALGSTVFATAGTEEKCRWCRDLGAAVAINYQEQDFVEAALRETAGAGVDVVLDMVGGDYLTRNLRAMAPGGRLVMIAFPRGGKVELDCTLILQKQLIVTGSRLRPRPIEEKGRLAEAVRKVVWPLVTSGAVRPVVDSTFSLREVRRAHERMEAGLHIGKILLTV